MTTTTTTTFRFVLAFNNCVTNDPCELCGSRCDPRGYDVMLSEEAKPYGYLVCDECAAQHAPELFQAFTDFRWPALPTSNEDDSFPVMWGKSIELANSVNERFPQ